MQLGKFADNFGQEIGLANLRGALGLLDIGADQRRKLGGKFFDAFDTFPLRAELFVEYDVLEFLQPVLEPRFQVRLVEELCVGQARTDHPLIAGDDRRAAVRRLDVRDEDEFGRQPVCPTSEPPLPGGERSARSAG